MALFVDSVQILSPLSMERHLFVDRSPILHVLSTKSHVFMDEVIKIVK